MKLIKYTALLTFVLIIAGCSTSTLIATQKSMPVVYEDTNDTHEVKNNITISLFRLNNYTDTPRAGMRASNIVEGVLLARGYNVTSHLKDKLPSMKKARKIAKSDGSKYFMYGGVSEWRYKTGIDGEPAVSLQLSLYKTKNKKLVWSSTASDSDWGNASIGTTAQDLIDEMISN
jgi:V8-like Glu-specific endopeptidase